LLNRITPDVLEHFWATGQEFRANLIKSEVVLNGYPTRGQWDGPNRKVWTFWQIMAEKGYMMGKAFFPKLDWNQEEWAELTIHVNDALDQVNGGRDLVGPEPLPLFKRN